MRSITVVPVVSPSAEKFVLEECTFGEASAPSQYFRVAPTDPLTHFPVAILSKALDLAFACDTDSSLSGLAQLEPSSHVRALSIIGTILDLNRSYWGEKHDCPVGILSINSGRGEQCAALRCQNGLILSFNASDQEGERKAVDIPLAASSLYLGPLEAHPMYVDASQVTMRSVPFFESIRSMIGDAVSRKLIHGAPSLIFPNHSEGERLLHRRVAMDILSVVKNSPYNQDLCAGSEGKARYRLIEALNAPGREGSIDLVRGVLERRPSLVAMPGWCEGIPFHKAAQLGSSELLELLFQFAENPLAGVSREALLSARDADGSVPYHLALRYGNDEAAELLRRKGGAQPLRNRYGYIPKE